MLKKIALFLYLFLPFLFIACSKPAVLIYSSDTPMQVEVRGDSLKILQLTDLHLTYGIDANDRSTYSLIRKLVKKDDWDLVVITGDMTMSPLGPILFKKLIKVMEELKTPWTFIFGNHETDYHLYEDYLTLIEDTKYLVFKVGPKMVDGGAGNFMIEFMKEGALFYKAYFLDSHQEREEYSEEEGEYGFLSTAQVEWYQGHSQTDTTPSIMFMHIPIRQYKLIETDPNLDYIGVYKEGKVCAQGIDTGIFAAITEIGKTKAVFVGHDHLSDFHFTLEGVILGYGRASGYNGYGYLEKGGRMIEIDADYKISTEILLESGVD